MSKKMKPRMTDAAFDWGIPEPHIMLAGESAMQDGMYDLMSRILTAIETMTSGDFDTEQMYTPMPMPMKGYGIPEDIGTDPSSEAFRRVRALINSRRESMGFKPMLASTLAKMIKGDIDSDVHVSLNAPSRNHVILSTVERILLHHFGVLEGHKSLMARHQHSAHDYFQAPHTRQHLLDVTQLRQLMFIGPAKEAVWPSRSIYRGGAANKHFILPSESEAPKRAAMIMREMFDAGVAGQGKVSGLVPVNDEKIGRFGRDVTRLADALAVHIRDNDYPNRRAQWNQLAGARSDNRGTRVVRSTTDANRWAREVFLGFIAGQYHLSHAAKEEIKVVLGLKSSQAFTHETLLAGWHRMALDLPGASSLWSTIHHELLTKKMRLLNQEMSGMIGLPESPTFRWPSDIRSRVEALHAKKVWDTGLLNAYMSDNPPSNDYDYTGLGDEQAMKELLKLLEKADTVMPQEGEAYKYTDKEK